MKKILFVDDEEQILRSITRLFRTTDYDIYTAPEGESALKILETEEIDLIISDMRMPFMDGYGLLSKVKELYPKVIRVMLSGYTEEKLIFKAIQKNIAKLYVFKPWENEKLLNVVDQIFESKKSIKDNNLLIHINNIEELITTNVNYQRILSLIQSGTDIEKITFEIEKDQSIALKVLHVANSAYCNVKTGSIKQAVSYLGLQNINNIILSYSAIDTFDNDSLATYLNMLSKHSFVTNKLVKYIYNKLLCKELSEKYSAIGLLHDVGIVFLFKCFGEKYYNLFIKSIQENINIAELEREILGTTHEEVGGYLLNWWGLPDQIVEAAFFHHMPMDIRVINKEMVCVVHLADKYSWDIIKEKCPCNFNDAVFDFLNIEKGRFEEELKNFMSVLGERDE
ncbi:MAG: signal transduction protein [Clostridiales bacterium GWE2_32_10]|nr:MAG: signal transduction protein [Clostridiales bacterium GWE2_32_10]HBY19833.1 response regulator [Clostridiales bacterium]